MRKISIIALVALLMASCGQRAQQKSAMKETVEIQPTSIKENAIELFDRQWALVTAGVPGDVNTMTIFPQECRGALQYLGSHSGRDGDKIKESGLTLEWLESGLPSFEEADMVIEARKIYGYPFDGKGFGDVPEQFYASGRMGVHSVYVGEIEHVWVRGREAEL